VLQWLGDHLPLSAALPAELGEALWRVCQRGGSDPKPETCFTAEGRESSGPSGGRVRTLSSVSADRAGTTTNGNSQGRGNSVADAPAEASSGYVGATTRRFPRAGRVAPATGRVKRHPG